jgi:hypothetical protein
MARGRRKLGVASWERTARYAVIVLAQRVPLRLRCLSAVAGGVPVIG